MKYLFLHISFIFCITPLFSQVKEFVADMQKIQDLMISKLPITIKASYTLYATHDAVSPMSSTSSITYLSGQHYYQHIEDVHTIIEKNMVAIVDISESTIVLDKKEMDMNDLLLSFQMGDIVDFIKDVQIKDGSEYKTYNVNFQPYFSFKSIIIKYAKRLQFIDQVELFYASSAGLEDNLQDEEKPKLVIKLNQVENSSHYAYRFQNNPFFKLTGTKAIPTGKYSKYSVINNLKANE
ncbi:MAG: hypothetical protein KDC49_12460 [Saprospiraceae bacterium]|nr:hypothetical protein [Saprospiraceae bacterium]